MEYTQEEVKNLEKKYKEEKSKQALNDLSDYEKNIKDNGKYKYLITKVNKCDTNILKDICDSLLNKMGTGFILIANQKESNISYIARSNLDNVKAGDLIKKVVEPLNGKGGGSPTFAQGGTSSIEKADDILKEVVKDIKKND